MKKILGFMSKNKRCIIFISAFLLINIFAYSLTMDSKRLYKTSEDMLANGSITVSDNQTDVEQKIKIENPTLEGISLKFKDVSRDKNIQILIELLDENKKLINAWKVNACDVINDEYTYFELPNRLTGIKNKKYTLVIKGQNSLKKGQFSLLTSSCSIEDNKLLVNEEEKNGVSLCYKVVNYSINSKIVVIVTLGISIIILGIYFFLEKKNVKIHNRYLIIYSILGVIYMATVPLYMVPDETEHYSRALDISEGKFISPQNEEGKVIRTLSFPKEWMERMHSQYDIISNSDSKSDGTNYNEDAYDNTALYSPVTYIPQAIGIKISKIFTNNNLCISYMAKMVNFLFILFITYFAIKYTPFGKEIMMLISLIPMNIYESISLSSDGMVVAIIFAMISLVLNLRYTNSKLNKKKLCLLYLFAIIIALNKIVYVPVCLIYFLIPKDKFKNEKQYWTNVAILGAMVAILSIGWILISSRYLIEYRPGVNSSEQIKFIISNPMRYILIICNTIIKNGESYLSTMFGASLGWLNIEINRLIIYIYIFSIFYYIIKGKKENKNAIKNDKITRINMGIIYIIISLLIFTSIYVQWTPVRNSIIEGIQGRYFIPILMLFILSITKNVEEYDTKSSNSILISIVVNICVVSNLLFRCIL